MRADRSLQAILFTDIVDSTARAAQLGDRAWRALLRRHHALVRRQLELHGGLEVGTAGDGFVATFERPGDAILCACAVRDGVRGLGLEIRGGVHMGGVEWEAGTVGGIAVHIGARVAAEAGPGDVLVSSTVHDLETGSGFAFEDRGARSLKGVPGEWRLFAVTSCPAARPGVRRHHGMRHATRGHGILWGVLAFLMLYSLAGLYVGLRSDAGEDHAAAPAGRRDTRLARSAAPDAPPRAPEPSPAVAGAPAASAMPPAVAAEPADSSRVEPAAAAADLAAGEAADDSAGEGADDTAGEPAAAAARASYEAVSRTLEKARRAARDAGAPSLAAKAFGAAESERAAAAAAAGSGRYADAETAARRSARSYEAARATAGLRARLDAARDSLSGVRAAADPRAAAFGQATALEERSRRAEGAGRFQEALGDVAAAAAAYRAARSAPPPAAPAAAPRPAADVAAAASDSAAGTPAVPSPAPSVDGRSPAPAGPPGDAGDSPEAAARAVLSEMARALEAEDLGGLRRTWVGLGASDAANFQRWFDEVRDIEVSYDLRSAERTGERIVATVQTRFAAFNESANRREDQSFRQTLEFALQDGRWVLVASR